MRDMGHGGQTINYFSLPKVVIMKVTIRLPSDPLPVTAADADAM